MDADVVEPKDPEMESELLAFESQRKKQLGKSLLVATQIGDICFASLSKPPQDHQSKFRRARVQAG